MTLTYNQTAEGRRTARAYGSLGGLSFAARNDVHASAARARAGQIAGYANGHECGLCPATVIPTNLPDEERARRSIALRKVHMKRMALKRHGF